MIPSIGEILIIGVVGLAFVAARYFYVKLQEGRRVFKQTSREELEEELRE